VCAYHCERDVITMDPDVREVLLPLQPRREARL
jgi:hypothetical protein